jgi:MarR family transcriptional regulator, organic hydroperoxide resistance regulator
MVSSSTVSAWRRAQSCQADLVTRTLATSFETADDSPGLMLWRVTNTWQAAMRQALHSFELTHVQFVLLATLVWMRSEVPVTQRELAAHARTDPMMTSQVLRTLERKKLIQRLRHPTDARARALVATPEGIALANRANLAVEAVDASFFGRLASSQPDLVRLLKILDADGPKRPEDTETDARRAENMSPRPRKA